MTNYCICTSSTNDNLLPSDGVQDDYPKLIGSWDALCSQVVDVVGCEVLITNREGSVSSDVGMPRRVYCTKSAVIAPPRGTFR